MLWQKGSSPPGVVWAMWGQSHDFMSTFMNSGWNVKLGSLHPFPSYLPEPHPHVKDVIWTSEEGAYFDVIRRLT